MARGDRSGRTLTASATNDCALVPLNSVDGRRILRKRALLRAERLQIRPALRERFERAEIYSDQAVENDFHADVILQEDRAGNGEWLVSYQDDDGAIYLTVFSGPKPRYGGKVVVLINDQALSWSETACLCFSAVTDVTFVGSPTGGADGEVSCFVLPGGVLVYFTGSEIRYPDERVWRVGVQPTFGSSRRSRASAKAATSCWKPQSGSSRRRRIERRTDAVPTGIDTVAHLIKSGVPGRIVTEQDVGRAVATEIPALSTE